MIYFNAYLNQPNNSVQVGTTLAAIPFNATTTSNAGTMLNLTTGTFMAPQTGLYHISVSVQFNQVAAGTNGGNATVAFGVSNGTTTYTINSQTLTLSTTVPNALSFAAVVALQAGDMVQVFDSISLVSGTFLGSAVYPAVSPTWFQAFSLF